LQRIKDNQARTQRGFTVAELTLGKTWCYFAVWRK
jgi:hypothetical protein